MKIVHIVLVMCLVAAVSCANSAYRARIINLKTQITNCTTRFVCALDSPGGDQLCTMECIDKNLVCDGIDDCSGGEDEMNCPDEPECICEPEEYLCRDNATCIDRALVCDGNTGDCPDDDDEEDCPVVQECPLNSYICSNGTAIPIESYCDGTIDCGGGDDEPGRCQCAAEADPTGCVGVISTDFVDDATSLIGLLLVDSEEDCETQCCLNPNCLGIAYSELDIPSNCALYDSSNIASAEIDPYTDGDTCEAMFYPINLFP